MVGMIALNDPGKLAYHPKPGDGRLRIPWDGRPFSEAFLFEFGRGHFYRDDAVFIRMARFPLICSHPDIIQLFQAEAKLKRLLTPSTAIRTTSKCIRHARVTDLICDVSVHNEDRHS